MKRNKTGYFIKELLKFIVLLTFIVLTIYNLVDSIKNGNLSKAGKNLLIVSSIISFYPVAVTLATSVKPINKVVHKMRIKRKAFGIIPKQRLFYKQEIDLMDYKNALINDFSTKGFIINKAIIQENLGSIHFEVVKKGKLPIKFEISNQTNRMLETSFYMAKIKMTEIVKYIEEVQEITDIIKNDLSVNKESFFLSIKYPENSNPYIKYYTDYGDSKNITINLTNQTLMNNDIIEVSAHSAREAISEVKTSLFKLS